MFDHNRKRGLLSWSFIAESRYLLFNSYGNISTSECFSQCIFLALELLRNDISCSKKKSLKYSSYFSFTLVRCKEKQMFIVFKHIVSHVSANISGYLYLYKDIKWMFN